MLLNVLFPGLYKRRFLLRKCRQIKLPRSSALLFVIFVCSDSCCCCCCRAVSISACRMQRWLPNENRSSVPKSSVLVFHCHVSLWLKWSRAGTLIIASNTWFMSHLCVFVVKFKWNSSHLLSFDRYFAEDATSTAFVICAYSRTRINVFRAFRPLTIGSQMSISITRAKNTLHSSILNHSKDHGSANVFLFSIMTRKDSNYR